jgi:GT2 family glycosyltransferase
MSNQPLGILIVVRNERHNLEMLFSSLSRQTYKNFRLYFIDNASTDGSLEFAKKLNETCSFQMEFISLDTDTGYTGGNNIGAQKAMEDGCEILFIINNDLEIGDNCIEVLVNFMDENQAAGAAGPLIYYWSADKTPNRIQSFGVTADFKKQKISINHVNEIDENTSLPEILKADYLSGAALMIRSGIVKENGLFDTRYFLYKDEIDLAYRLRLKGYSYYAVSKAKIWHNNDDSARSREYLYTKYYYMTRNSIVYFYKFHMFPRAILEVCRQILLFPVVARFCIRSGGVKMLGYFYLGLFAGLFNIQGKRKLTFS